MEFMQTLNMLVGNGSANVGMATVKQSLDLADTSGSDRLQIAKANAMTIECMSNVVDIISARQQTLAASALVILEKVCIVDAFVSQAKKDSVNAAYEVLMARMGINAGSQVPNFPFSSVEDAVTVLSVRKHVEKIAFNILRHLNASNPCFLGSVAEILFTVHFKNTVKWDAM